jgi:hypothetical protein
VLGSEGMMPRLSSFAVAGCLLVAVTFLATTRNAWAQVPQYYDGAVSKPEIKVWFDASMGETNVVAVGESWGDATDGNVRLEASFSYKGRSSSTPPRTVTLALVRVGADPVWKKSTRFKVLADGAPVAVTFSRREPTYESRGVKLGVEETLIGQLTPADLKRLSKARRAQVKLGKDSYDISQQTQAKLAELIDQPHAAPVAP